LNGRKNFVTNGGVADKYIVFAKTNPPRGRRGISAFVVDKGLPGMTFSSKDDKIGMRGVPSCSITFKEVPVSKSEHLGEEGEGFKIAMETLNRSRPAIGAQALGIAESAMVRAAMTKLGAHPTVIPFSDLYMALAYTVRNQLLEHWLHTVQNYGKPGVRIVSYLSAEFLLGPHLENNLINLGIYDEARDALKDLGLDLRKIIDQEENRVWETEAWAGWQPVIWIALPRSKFRQWAMGSATNSGSLIKRSVTAGRWKKRTSGCDSETPGKSSGRKLPLKST
jgi:hypothetical protein